MKPGVLSPRRVARRARGACVVPAAAAILTLGAWACGSDADSGSAPSGDGSIGPPGSSDPARRGDGAALGGDGGSGGDDGHASALEAEAPIGEAMATAFERGAAFEWQREIRLRYPATWQGAEGITADNGAHNQGYAFDGQRHYTATQDRAGAAWYFVHDAGGELLCATRAASPFPESLESGKVHPGGGYLRGGWFTTVISNQRDSASSPRGAFAVARFRAPAACQGPECSCEVSMEADTEGAPRVTVSDAYMGFVATGGARGEDSYVFDIRGEKAFRCDSDGHGCARVTAAQQASATMPQQCVTLRAPSRRLMVCTPFPNPVKRAYVEVFAAIGTEADSASAFVDARRIASPAIASPSGLIAFGEGISVHGEEVYLASGASPDANCGSLGLVSPCTSPDGEQVVRVYRVH